MTADVIPMRRVDVEVGEGRVPPHDLDAEAAVLSAVMLGGNDHLALVRDFLRAEHFYSEAHRRIFEAALELATEKTPLDVVAIGNWLKTHDRIAQVGGMSYLTELLGASPAVANIVPHARIIHDRARERTAIATAQRIAATGYLGIADTQTYLDDATRAFADIARASVGAKLESNVDMIKRILKTANERATATTKVPLGISTGIEAWDEEWGGLHGGELTIFGARRGVGKTSLAVQLLATVARARLGVLLFSQDSTRDELASDLISHEAKVDSKRLRNGDMSVDEWRRVTEAGSNLGTRTFWIDDTRKIHVGMIRARSLATADESMKRERIPLGLIIVDYIQQLAPAPGWEHKKKYEWLGHAANELKTLAVAMKIPIVVMGQQKGPDRGKPQFQMTESPGLIEAEANNLFFIAYTGARSRKLHCEKVRRGAVRDIELSFDGPSRTFADAKLEAESRRYAAPPDETFWQDGGEDK